MVLGTADDADALAPVLGIFAQAGLGAPANPFREVGLASEEAGPEPGVVEAVRVNEVRSVLVGSPEAHVLLVASCAPDT
eukprot:10999307-Alexandrium_andersonii.AAC.1